MSGDDTVPGFWTASDAMDDLCYRRFMKEREIKMRGLTEKEKVQVAILLDLIKRWWNSPGGSLPERSLRDQIVEVIAEGMKK